VVSYSDIILGDIWAFNPKDNSWHRAAPTGEQILPREGHSAVTIAKTEMWVFGGISYGHIPFNDLWMYDSAKDQWSVQKPLGTLPPPRWLHTADVWVDSNNVPRMYIFGGVTKNFIPLDDLWYLDRIENKWHHPKSVGAPPFPRMLHAGNIIEDKLFVHGGVANNIPFEDLITFDLRNRKWEEQFPTGPYPNAREGHTTCKVQPDPAPEQEIPPPNWKPIEPNPDSKDKENLQPLLHQLVPRPLNRYRKYYWNSRWLFMFGGAGPKAREGD